MKTEQDTPSRRFFRHPSSVPLQCRKLSGAKAMSGKLRDISFGGMAFTSPENFKAGDVVVIRYPAMQDGHDVTGEIIWSAPASRSPRSHRAYGMRFTRTSMLSRARMVEQICRIQLYRAAREKRFAWDLTPQQAAKEWITHCAPGF